MRLQLSTELEQFRQEMRAFFTTKVPQEIRDTVAARRHLARAQYVEARAVWHAQVCEHKAMSAVRDLVEGRAGVDCFRYVVSGILEGQSQYATEAVFIFDE